MPFLERYGIRKPLVSCHEHNERRRRALLTAGQLPTYFVGYRAVKELAHDLQVMHPDWSLQQIHDLLLSFGSPAPRYVREMVGL